MVIYCFNNNGNNGTSQYGMVITVFIWILKPEMDTAVWDNFEDTNYKISSKKH